MIEFGGVTEEERDVVPASITAPKPAPALSDPIAKAPKDVKKSTPNAE